MAANYKFFVSININLTNLVLEMTIQNSSYSQTSLVRPILMDTKQF